MQIGTVHQATLEGAEARLPRWMAGFAAAGMLVAFSMGHARVAAGFGLGAAIAIVGYSWLHKAVVSLMDAGRTHPSKMTLGKLMIRYPLAILVIFVFYRENWLPFEAVLAGFFVPVAGALAESVYQVGSALLHSKAQ
ncbi:MAG: ATP synthase subunit I [Acidobacteriota bacterium]